MRASDRRRFHLSRLMTALCTLCVLLALTPVALILFYVVRQGIGALDFAFFTEIPLPVGEAGGGMANAIVGTLILCGLAAVLAVPAGILAAVYIVESRGSRLARDARLAADVLNGVPSIVIGVFVYVVLVLPVKHFSALAGGAALAVMMLPIVVRTTEELLRLVPASLHEGSLALGASQARTIFSVVLPAALPGIATGVILALARVAGETAPLLFTAFGNRFWSTSLTDPISALTLQIYAYAISPYDDWHRQAWAGALVLVAIVVVCSAAARLATRRLR